MCHSMLCIPFLGGMGDGAEEEQGDNIFHFPQILWMTYNAFPKLETTLIQRIHRLFRREVKRNRAEFLSLKVYTHSSGIFGQ